MAPVPMHQGLLLAGILFAIGLTGLLVRRNVIFMLIVIRYNLLHYDIVILLQLIAVACKSHALYKHGYHKALHSDKAL